MDGGGASYASSTRRRTADRSRLSGQRGGRDRHERSKMTPLEEARTSVAYRLRARAGGPPPGEGGGSPGRRTHGHASGRGLRQHGDEATAGRAVAVLGTTGAGGRRRRGPLRAGGDPARATTRSPSSTRACRRSASAPPRARSRSRGGRRWRWSSRFPRSARSSWAGAWPNSPGRASGGGRGRDRFAHGRSPAAGDGTRPGRRPAPGGSRRGRDPRR